MIAFDTSSNSGYQAASGSYNWTHTVGAGNNQILVVSVGLLSVTNSVTALTYNGVSLTKLRADVSVSTTIRTEIWYLLAPAQGANSVAVTLNTASVSGSVATSYNNVDQSGPVDAQNGTTGTTGAGGGSASVSTTTVKNNAWIVDAAATPTSFTVGSGQTQRANINGAVGSAGQSDKGPINPAGATTMQWDNISALTSWTISTISLAPVKDVSVSDSSVTSESLNHYSDQVDAMEQVKLLATSLINKSDTVTTSESLSALVTPLLINVSDNIAASESITVILGNFNTAVSDSATTSESLAHYSDQIDVMELIIVAVQQVTPLNVSVSDGTILSDNLDILRNGARDIIITDSRLLDESGNFITDENGNYITDESPIELTVASESVNILSTNNINVSDIVLTNENITLSITSFINKSDTVITSESVQALLQNFIRIQDTLSIVENLGFFYSILDLSTSDVVSTGESIVIVSPILFIDIESLILTAPGSIATPMTIPGEIILKMIIE